MIHYLFFPLSLLLSIFGLSASSEHAIFCLLKRHRVQLENILNLRYCGIFHHGGPLGLSWLTFSVALVFAIESCGIAFFLVLFILIFFYRLSFTISWVLFSEGLNLLKFQE